MKRLEGQIHLFLEQAEGYVKDLEKSTSWALIWTEVFEHCAQNDQAWVLWVGSIESTAMTTLVLLAKRGVQ